MEARNINDEQYEHLNTMYSDYMSVMHAIYYLDSSKIPDLILNLHNIITKHDIEPELFIKVMFRASLEAVHTLEAYAELIFQFCSKESISNKIIKKYARFQLMYSILAKKYSKELNIEDCTEYNDQPIEKLLNYNCDNDLLLAIYNDDLKSLIKIIDENNYDLNMSVDENKLIDWCAIYGSVKCFRFLRSNGQELESIENAISGRNQEIITEALQESDLDDSTMIKLIYRSIDSYQNDLAINMLMKSVNILMDAERITKVCNLQIFLFLLHNSDMKNAIACAVHFGIPSLIEKLIKFGFEIDVHDINSYSPLIIAAIHNYLSIAKMLIIHGANLNYKDDQNNKPLIFAVRYQHIDMVKLLLDSHALVNARNSNNWTALHFAVNQNEIEIVKLLVERGADVNAQDIWDKTPLQIAYDHNYKEIINFLTTKS